MQKIIIAILIFLSSTNILYSQKPVMRLADKIRIREAVKLAKVAGDDIWYRFSETPFAILLISDSVEYLMFHPNPSGDFKLLEEDKFLNTKIYYRKQQFPSNLLATFPAVNGVSTIVVGTPEKTGKTSTEWTVTLLHEHFHQYVSSYFDYYASVEKLDLANGDKTGMWMLNYPFSYDKLDVVEHFYKYANLLQKSLNHFTDDDFKKSAKKTLSERKFFTEILSRKDYNYFSFQIWQEGLARYTEYKILTRIEVLGLTNKYKPSKEFTELKDYIAFDIYANYLFETEKENLTKYSLAIDKRVCFYSMGFAEGLLLDAVNPDWRKMYLQEKFFIEKYFE